MSLVIYKASVAYQNTGFSVSIAENPQLLCLDVPPAPQSGAIYRLGASVYNAGAASTVYYSDYFVVDQGSVIITTPASNSSYKIGDTVDIAWSASQFGSNTPIVITLFRIPYMLYGYLAVDIPLANAHQSWTIAANDLLYSQPLVTANDYHLGLFTHYGTNSFTSGSFSIIVSESANTSTAAACPTENLNCCKCTCRSYVPCNRVVSNAPINSCTECSIDYCKSQFPQFCNVPGVLNVVGTSCQSATPQPSPLISSAKSSVNTTLSMSLPQHRNAGFKLHIF